MKVKYFFHELMCPNDTAMLYAVVGDEAWYWNTTGWTKSVLDEPFKWFTNSPDYSPVSFYQIKDWTNVKRFTVTDSVTV